MAWTLGFKMKYISSIHFWGDVCSYEFNTCITDSCNTPITIRVQSNSNTSQMMLAHSLRSDHHPLHPSAQTPATMDLFFVLIAPPTSL